MISSILNIVYSIVKLLFKIISKSKNLYHDKKRSNKQDDKIIKLTEKANNPDSIIELTDISEESDFIINLYNPIETENKILLLNTDESTTLS